MNTERIKAIQKTTAYPESRSVNQALLQVWNECEQEANIRLSEQQSKHEKEMKDFAEWHNKYIFSKEYTTTELLTKFKNR